MPELANYANSEILGQIFRVYGDEWAAVILQAGLIDDPEQREATWRIIEETSQRKITESPMTSGTYDPTISTGGGLYNKDKPTEVYDPQEALATLIENPESFKGLNYADQLRVRDLARLAVEHKQEITEESQGILEQAQQASDVWMREKGWEMVIDDDEEETLKGIIAHIDAYQDSRGASMFEKAADRFLAGNRLRRNRSCQGDVRRGD